MATKTKAPPDPDEQLLGPAAAREAGIAPSTFRAYRARGAARVPEPDGHEPLTGAAWWYRRTMTAYREQRPGRGWRKGVTGQQAATT